MRQMVRAAVRVAPGKTEMQEFRRPDVDADSALLRVEVAGICGTDVKIYANAIHISLIPDLESANRPAA